MQNQIVTVKKKVPALLMGVAPPTRATISRAFEPADFDVMWAANASEAMDLSTRHHGDLLLLDLSQPLRTGREIFERLKTLNFGVPVDDAGMDTALWRETDVDTDRFRPEPAT